MSSSARPTKPTMQAKRVTPPAVPDVYRHSGSSFGSAGYGSAEDSSGMQPSATQLADAPIRSKWFLLILVCQDLIYKIGVSLRTDTTGAYSFPVQPLTHKAAVYYHQQLALQEDQGIDLTQSPGRDSPGSSSGSAGSGSRHSTASLDSGRASSYHTTGSRCGVSTAAGSSSSSSSGVSGVAAAVSSVSGGVRSSSGSSVTTLSSPRCSSLSSCSIGSVDRIMQRNVRSSYGMIDRKVK